VRTAQKIKKQISNVCSLIGCKALSLTKIMTVVKKEAPANFVPAAAVIRRGRALSRIIGRKEYVGCKLFYKLNFRLIFKTIYGINLLEYNRG